MSINSKQFKLTTSVHNHRVCANSHVRSEKQVESCNLIRNNMEVCRMRSLTLIRRASILIPVFRALNPMEGPANQRVRYRARRERAITRYSQARSRHRSRSGKSKALVRIWRVKTRMRCARKRWTCTPYMWPCVGAPAPFNKPNIKTRAKPDKLLETMWTNAFCALKWVKMFNSLYEFDIFGRVINEPRDIFHSLSLSIE